MGFFSFSLCPRDGIIHCKVSWQNITELTQAHTHTERLGAVG